MNESGVKVNNLDHDSSLHIQHLKEERCHLNLDDCSLTSHSLSMRDNGKLTVHLGDDLIGKANTDFLSNTQYKGTDHLKFL